MSECVCMLGGGGGWGGGQGAIIRGRGLIEEWPLFVEIR